ncbi:thioredoxin-dependent thiol peroxidase [Alicyclobacillus curvatus]|jgi:thioredoxin-dependent peroxiredoxin|nr:thioredoxin-dependent thiol peroxidase [Alicyclobacillus curvatus]
MLEVGMEAPDFTLEDQSGQSVHLADYRGKVVVLYFYPKDSTPGCTKEACSFRDANALIADIGTVVLGVSRDSVNSHRRFADKYDLSFPLLADTEGEVCSSYGVLQEKTMFGKTGVGIVRTTYVIDKEGKIAKVFPKVKVDGHVDEVLTFVRSLG